MVNIGGTSTAGALAPAVVEEAGAALGDSPGGERDLLVEEEEFNVGNSLPMVREDF